MIRNHFITAACVSLEISPSEVLNKGLYLDLSGAEVIEIWNAQNETKHNPQLNVSTSLADSFNSQETTAREIEGCSYWCV